MRKLTYILLLFAFVAQGQIINPVKWKTKVVQKSETEFELVMDATIEKEWHMYSQFTPEDGPLPTVFDYKNAKGNFSLVGKTKESAYKKVFNDIFEVDEYYFANTAQFKQVIKVTNVQLKEVKVYVEYQVCKEQCIQQDETFTFKLPEIKPIVADSQSVETPLSDVNTTDLTSINKENSSIENSEDSKEVAVTEINAEEKEEEKSLWGIFILAFLGGFAALLTPCVFPMIPMTVSFFTKQSKTKAAGIKNAFIYGISIIVIYVGLGMIITALFGIDSLNALSTNVWFNVIFFVILIVFAASFLGAFEIVLPNSFLNKIDRQADRGGIIGIFFMALALAVVSFSCTGPIVGSLLGESARQGGIGPIVGMLGFSSAIALPFMLFAMFPGWMNSLPKSGGWLNTVKVSLGFLELAFAFKFLSNADLVLQTHLLEREVFLAIWIAVFGAWALYLFGKLILPHDSPMTHISVGRLFVALFVTTFTIYLIPGLWGAPLKILSGFTPPMTYSESPNGVGYQNAFNGTTEATSLPENAHIGPLGITAFHDYEEGLAYAKKVNKPVLLDFTGHACANCRKMEENVWSDAEILKILKNEIVLISLYGDDQRELPKEEQYVSKSGSEVTTIGKKWREYQIERYNINAQPYYVVLDTEGKDISKPVGYTPDVTEYKTWLKEGISKFKK
ncbi:MULTISPECIES: protein-disulfide reductase DsbD [unclassified Flavobacterium]|uniref:protein-disulfide reductase DsbD family protein n=1 Tax=unclassified Flavobacterium TaxID=196869 RepID=UPI0012925B39|nr:MULTISPECIES: cytochrome c biogenesis protein CcdA [unclassified Flavobacterium]MQP52769.1 thioredoxin fold domain-containing protein [Flavobacterium sp. LMO9]MQP63043.1 thioredoxin fold domain-containing protein [Flavobacterium sp. LMO6]